MQLHWMVCRSYMQLVCISMCLQDYQARFESFTKLYSFHHWETPDAPQPNLPAALARTQSSASSSSRREVSHYGCRPFDALFEGYFMSAAAAKAYLALFQASHKAAPYSKEVLRINSDHLADRVRCCQVCMAHQHCLHIASVFASV